MVSLSGPKAHWGWSQKVRDISLIFPSERSRKCLWSDKYPATLKLTVVPEDFSVAVVTFPSIRDAASAAAEVMQTGIPVAAMEIMDEVQMKVVNLGGATAPRVWKEVPTLFFKFSGTRAGVKENISLVQKIARIHKGSNFEFAKDAREQKLLWSARKESLWSMLALRKDGEEVCE